MLNVTLFVQHTSDIFNSCWCMTKTIQYCKVISLQLNKLKKNWKKEDNLFLEQFTKFQESDKFFQVAQSHCILSSYEWEFLLSHTLTSIWQCCVPNTDHLYRSEVVYHCCSNLHFSADILSWESFHILTFHLCLFFDEMSVMVLVHF